MFVKSVNNILSVFGINLQLSARKSIKSDAFLAQQHLLKPKLANPIIFDIGAGDGNTCMVYKALFYDAAIFSFEPHVNTYLKLKKLEKIPGIKTFNKAVGDKCGKFQFTINNASATSSILDTNEKANKIWKTDGLQPNYKTEVDMVTVDSIINCYEIQGIDILKMDVQGAEHLILKGAEKAIKEERINLIYSEIITADTYVGQLDLPSIFKMYYDYGFSLYNVYNLNICESSGLRQLDALFVRQGSF